MNRQSLERLQAVDHSSVESEPRCLVVMFKFTVVNPFVRNVKEERADVRSLLSSLFSPERRSLSHNLGEWKASSLYRFPDSHCAVVDTRSRC